MKVELLHLDKTLSCGQVFRWRKEGDWWHGYICNRPVSLRQNGCDLEWEGQVDEREVGQYLRCEDDLDFIYQDIMVSCGDERVAALLRDHRGLRILRQDPWECSASYVLATYVHIPRIEQMIDKVCRTFGTDLGGGRFTFPSTEQVLERPEEAKGCGLGFRCERFVELARAVHRGELDFDALKIAPYQDCVRELKRFHGIGDKVADCIALFALDHMEAFPVDVRIGQAMQRMYCLSGSYKKVSEAGRLLFGPYAGVAQEYIYLAAQRRSQRGTTVD
jgi:N-glycosylase/DNA lyase